MNKKLLAVAVAGVLAAPAAALAQSSVTISGLFSVSVGQLKIGSYANAGIHPTGGNASETRMTDNSSRIVFNVVEDLGGGLQAIGQIDWRVSVDNGADTASGGAGGAGGNNHVGLRSKTWGRIFVGRQDLHYFNTESDINAGGRGDLKVNPFTILAFTNAGVVANASRTPNVVHYTTPDWSGFTAILAYSTNPTPAAAGESDIGAVARKGRGWNVQPNFQGANWQVGYSYFRAKNDTLAGGPDQRGDRLYGSYRWGGFKVGAAWDKSKLTPAAGGLDLARRTAWSIPVSYGWGPHIVEGHFTKARDDKATALVQDGARMWAAQYTYNLSKRTSLSGTYARIRNDAGSVYNFFGATSGAIGHPSGGIIAGEDPRLWSMSIRHAF